MRQPPVGHGLLIHDVSRSHTTTHRIPYDSSRRVINSLQRPLYDSTQQTNIRAAIEIRTHSLSRRAAADLHLRPRGRWDQLNEVLCILNRFMSEVKYGKYFHLFLTFFT